MKPAQMLLIPCLLLAAADLPADEAGAPVGTAITFRKDLDLTENDEAILRAFITHAVEYADKLTAENVAAKCAEAPEMFAWIQFRYLNCLNLAYELTGDTKYLDLLRDKFALFQKVLRKSDDGYLGWWGKPIPPRQLKDNPGLQIEELQMTFRAIGMLSRWIELARQDPNYAKANAATIDAYIELMTKSLYPKWDAHGFFAEIPGRGGVYHGLDYPHPQRTTLSFEKLSIVVDGLLKLYRVTGDDQYLKRALQIGAWFRSNLLLKDGHYEWMSWVPAGKWDVNPGKDDAWAVSWIAPDPNAPWYVAALSIALNLYQHGLLFDDTDLARFIATQKTMCWNGDMEKPEYRTVAGTTSKWVKGRFLSDQLAHYDATLRKLAFAGPHEAQRVTDAASSWKGGANAQDYVREKYLMAPVVAKNPKPYATYGQAFLAKPENRAFHDTLAAETKDANHPVPRRPSEMGLKAE